MSFRELSIAGAITLAAAALPLQAANAEPVNHVTLAAIAGTTGYGGDVGWRFSRYFGLSAGYTGGFDWDDEFDTDEVHYEGDLGISAGSLKLNYFPFGGRFFLAAGAMFPDMTVDVTGTANDQGTFEYNGNTYSSAEVGSIDGRLTIADSVQPYLGFGWRSSTGPGLGFYSEVGVMATDIDVSLSSSRNFEASDPQFRRDIEREEADLKDDFDGLSVYPVALFGISYTF